MKIIFILPTGTLHHEPYWDLGVPCYQSFVTLRGAHYRVSAHPYYRVATTNDGFSQAAVIRLSDATREQIRANQPSVTPSPAAICQPIPGPGAEPVWPWVRREFLALLTDPLLQAIRERDSMGTMKYGVALHSHNGRDPKIDLLQELLDAIAYAAQCAMEHEHMEPDRVAYRAMVEQLIDMARRLV